MPKTLEQNRERMRARRATGNGMRRTRLDDMQRKYGMKPAKYRALLRHQDYRCAMCRTTDPGRGHEQFCIDHDHSTGDVRGLLCYRCNVDLGIYEKVRESATEYLSAPPCEGN